MPSLHYIQTLYFATAALKPYFKSAVPFATLAKVKKQRVSLHITIPLESITRREESKTVFVLGSLLVEAVK